MKIIVTGSLGHVGKPLTMELVQKGHAVVVISSKPEKQAEIEALGAAAAIGSLEDPPFLASVFDGADAVFVMVPPNFSEPDPRGYYRRIGRSYAQAIAKAGVRRVVHLSSWGAHLDHGTGFILGSHDMEGLLGAIPGVSVTHLRAGYFYYNLYSYIEMIRTQGIMGANYGGSDKLVMVAPSDIAATAAEELTLQAAGQPVRYVASAEHTADEVAAILGNALGRPQLKWITFSNERMKESLEQKGMPPVIVSNTIDLGASIHSGAMKEDYELHRPPVMGKVSLQEFAAEFVKAFG